MRLARICIAVFLSAVPSAGEHGKGELAFVAAPRKLQVFSLFPSGARRGTSVDVEILGANLDGLTRVDSDCGGLTASVLSSSYLRASVRFSIADPAEPSLCRLRLYSPAGVSNLEVFRIGDLPESMEREPNDSPERAQVLESPAIVDGRLFPDEDVDFYTVHGKAGRQLTAEVFACRNGSGLNPEIYLLDTTGRRLAVGVNEVGSDPVIRYRFDADGDYRLAVRGTFGVLNISFPTGHPAYVYQLRVAMDVPSLDVARPFQFTAGSSSSVHITGGGMAKVDALAFSDPGMKATILERSDDQIVARVESPTARGEKKMWAVAGPVRSNSVNLLVTAVADGSEDGEELTLSHAIAGQISKAHEVDAFTFLSPGAGLYVWELQSGRFPSRLDPKLELVDASGKVLDKKDGAPDSDVHLERALKAGEQVTVRVSQSLLDYHGSGYNYRLLVRPAQPGFTITPGSRQPAPKQLSGVDRIYLERGSEFALPLVIQWKEGFEDATVPIHIEVDGCPPGVSAEPLTVATADGKREKPGTPFTAKVDLKFRVSTDARMGVAPIRIRGIADWSGGNLKVYETLRVNASGSYVLSLSGGSPQSIDYRYLDVIEPVRYELRPEIGDERYPTRFTLRPGSTKPLLITVLSADSSMPKIQFEAENLPRGVRIAGVEALPDEQQYRLTMEASPDAERVWQPLVIIVGRLDGSVLTTPYFGMAVQ